MFIDWACTLNLIENDKNTGILKEFPLSVKKILVQQIVSSFLITDGSTSNPAILSTKAHVKWVMEVIEQGFLLPLEESKSIFDCVDLYKRWLFDARCKPQALIDDVDESFTQKILQHLTLAFQPRPITSREAVDTHIILCQKVLQLYLDIGRTLSKGLSSETLELWITLLLAVADSTLNINTRLEEPIVRAICPLLLKVLFEVWLHSRTRNAALWQHLNRYAYGWLHHMPAIHQWNLTCLALTSPLMQMVYGANTATPSSSTIQVRLEDISLEFDRDYLLYAWNRVLGVVSNPNAIKNPNIFAAAIGGIFQLVSMLLGATDDGNSILHIFGSWLFEAVKSPRPGFEEGVSLATEILSHIFQTCAPRIAFEPIYLSAYYSCLSEVLWCDGKILFSAVIHTQHLLSLDLPGSRILVPSFIRALGRILTIVPGSTSESLRRAAIRILGQLVCLSNLYEPVQFFHFFNKRPMEFYPPLPTDIIGKHELIQPDLATFRDVRAHVAHLILSSLNTETSPSNLSTLIWYILAFELEHQHQHVTRVVVEGRTPTVAFMNGAINILLKRSASLTGQWPADVVVHSFQLLSALAEHHSQLPNLSEFAHTIVRKLCKYIVFKCREQIMSQDSEELIALAIQTAADWVVAGNWIFDGNYKTDTSTLYMLFDALTIAMGGKDPNEEISSNSSISNKGEKEKDDISSTMTSQKEDQQTVSSNFQTTRRKLINVSRLPLKVREAAQSTMQTILTRVSCYPNPYATNQSDTSSSYVEADFIQQIRERAIQAGHLDFPVEQCIRFFTVNNVQLMTLIDQPCFTPDETPYTTMIIRDCTGRYVINTSIALIPRVPKKEDFNQEDQNSSSTNGPILSDNETTNDFIINNSSNQSNSSSTNSGVYKEGVFKSNYNKSLEEFDDINNYISRHQDEPFINAVNDQSSVESKMLKERRYGLDHKIMITPQVLKDQYSGDCKFQHSRVLLASLGFFTLENKGRVCQMDNSQSFYQAIRGLDSLSERISTRVSVFYVKKADQSEEDVLCNIGSDTTADYRDFVAGLGWTVNTSQHSGYMGGLDRRQTTGRVAQYYATSSREMIFYVSTMMPNAQDSSTDHKKKLLSKSPISVVWCESIDEFEKEMRTKSDILSKPNQFQLAIEPKPNNLFRVKTVHPSGAGKLLFGPILEDMIVSKHILAPLIKITINNAYNYILTNGQGGESSTRIVTHPFTTRRKFITEISDSFKAELRVMQNFQNVFVPIEEEKLYRTPNTPIIVEDNPIPFKPVRPTLKQRPVSVQISPVVPLGQVNQRLTPTIGPGYRPSSVMNPTTTTKDPQTINSPSTPTKNWGGLKPSQVNRPEMVSSVPSPNLRGNFLTRNRPINLSDDINNNIDQQQQQQNK